MIAMTYQHSAHPFRVPFVLLCALLFCAPPAIYGQSQTAVFDATNLRVPAELGATGVFIGGDDPAFARTDYDDSEWLSAEDKRPLHEIIPHSQPKVIWQRIHVKVSPNQSGPGIETWDVSDAFELYVNGQKLLDSGHFTPWAHTRSWPGLWRGFRTPKSQPEILSSRFAPVPARHGGKAAYLDFSRRWSLSAKKLRCPIMSFLALSTPTHSTGSSRSWASA